MINDVTDSGLMGDVKHSGMTMHPDAARDFLAELRLLMEKYEVEKIDIWWQHFTDASSEHDRPTASPPDEDDKNKEKAIIAKPRNSVMQFARMMEDVLKRNEDKGGWGHCTERYLFDRLIKETHELLLVLETDDGDVLRECCDVANFAMMIADNRGMPDAKEITGKE